MAIIIALGLVLAFNAFCQTLGENRADFPSQPSLWWVFFTDRGPNEKERVDSLTREWNVKSRERRRKNGSDVSEDDLPVWRDYMAAVRSAGARIRGESRWLNALSVEAPQEVLIAISNMPFVREISSVKRMIPQRLRGWEDVPLSG
ncbi:MAG: hypothetical protein ACK4OO_02875, partial [bacterium]